MPNQNTGITHCKRGHAFTETNTYVLPSGKRQCRACMAVRQARYHERLMETPEGRWLRRRSWIAAGLAKRRRRTEQRTA